jgi:hypothetical protein
LAQKFDISENLAQKSIIFANFNSKVPKIQTQKDPKSFTNLKIP